MSWPCDKLTVWRVDPCDKLTVWRVDRVTSWPCDELTGTHLHAGWHMHHLVWTSRLVTISFRESSQLLSQQVVMAVIQISDSLQERLISGRVDTPILYWSLAQTVLELNCRYDLAADNVVSNLLMYTAYIKQCISVNGTPISQLRDLTCHMGSHSVTCHLTQVNAPHLNPSQ